MNTKQLKWLSYLTFIVMFFATFGGTVVTKTDSGLGCGHEWPLCHGQFVPAHTVASLIEYSHRLVSGLAGLTAVAVVVAFWLYAKKRKDLRMYSVLTLIFVIVQALMGALAVVYDQSSAVLALHFGFSLIAFASSLMLALGARKMDKDSGTGLRKESVSVTPAFRNFVWAVTIYSYIVVYVGAYVSHTSSAGGCSGWPLCNGKIIPELTGSVGIAFIHRLAALVLLIVVAIMAHYAYWMHRNSRELRTLGIAAVTLCLLQVFSGAGIVYTLSKPELYIFAALFHNLLISSLFGVLCYLSVRVWQLGKEPAEQLKTASNV
ncbi:heme A synthase [Paenibacillus donghaensis]|uniref:COX15/CtaA family protein n=1 Tax=Paenibacillus donghaensis TaxID=414771 RepID=UPI001883969D|nr:heme A synthase [Paenibacillus donghaensis]MBE9915341.1 heme A synthase [Paenibacillus donghaensis]